MTRWCHISIADEGLGLGLLEAGCEHDCFEYMSDDLTCSTFYGLHSLRWQKQEIHLREQFISFANA